MSSNLPSDRKRREIQEPFEDLRKTMNDFFHKGPVKGFLQSIDEFFKAPFATFPIEVKETNHEYVVTAELPGVKKEQISIDILDYTLSITVKNQEVLTEEDEVKQMYSRRQSFQQMSRNIYLNHPINERKVRATYQNGLLKISIPKPKGKTITIDAE